METESNSVFGVRSPRSQGPEVAEREAEEIAARHWGVAGQARRIAGEVDENFRIVTADGEFLLKIVPADEPTALTDLVTRALIHVASSGQGVAVQEVQPTLDGRHEAEFEDSARRLRRARLTAFVPGQVLRGVEVDQVMREQLGATLARLARALRDFYHPAADRELSWDLRHADRMRSMLDELPSNERRATLRDSLDSFGAALVPRFEGWSARCAPASA